MSTYTFPIYLLVSQASYTVQDYHFQSLELHIGPHPNIYDGSTLYEEKPYPNTQSRFGPDCVTGYPASFAQIGASNVPDHIDVTLNFPSNNDPFASGNGYYLKVQYGGRDGFALLSYAQDGYGYPSAPQGIAAPVALSGSLALDAHRRPLAVLPDGTASAPTLSTAYSNDAGHTFSSMALGTGSDPSLIVDPRDNTYRILYSANGGMPAVFGTLQDGFVADPHSPGGVGGQPGQIGPSGIYPAACPHPTDRDFVLLAYLDNGDSNSLKTAWSYDGGRTAEPVCVIATNQNFSTSGRPALCWLGETAFLVSGPGPALLVRASQDRGKTWGAAVTVATAPANTNYVAVAYSGLSLLGWQGRLYLLAWNYGSGARYGSGTPFAPFLWTSGDMGKTWAPSPGSLPSGLMPPSALGVIPAGGQLRLGISHHSDDDGLTWQVN